MTIYDYAASHASLIWGSVLFFILMVITFLVAVIFILLPSVLKLIDSKKNNKKANLKEIIIKISVVLIGTIFLVSFSSMHFSTINEEIELANCQKNKDYKMASGELIVQDSHHETLKSGDIYYLRLQVDGKELFLFGIDEDEYQSVISCQNQKVTVGYIDHKEDLYDENDKLIWTSDNIVLSISTVE